MSNTSLPNEQEMNWTHSQYLWLEQNLRRSQNITLKNLRLMHKCFWSKRIYLSISLSLPSSLIKDDWKQDLRLCKNPCAPDATSLTLFRVDIIIVSIATTCNGTVDYDFRKRINNSRQNPKGIIWFSCTIKDSVSRGIRRKSNRKYSVDTELLWK